MWVKCCLVFFLFARNSTCASPLPDFLMEFRRDDSEDAFDIQNTWNIALLFVTVIDFDAGRLALSCHFAQNHVPNSNGARWRTTRLLTTDALQCLSLFVFLSSVEAEFESQSHFLWHTLRHTHKRRMRLRGSSVHTAENRQHSKNQRVPNWVNIVLLWDTRTHFGEKRTGSTQQTPRWWDLNVFEHDRNVIFG